MKTVCGIDEAGRGAVIGPLIVAGVALEEKQLRLLKRLGVKDSKLLSPQKREEIFKQMKKYKIKFHFFEILPKEIEKHSLNVLEIEKAISLINYFKPNKVFLDVPAFGKGIENYCNAIRSAISRGIEIIGGNKLDQKNVVVGAASIVAKVIRERAIARLKKKYGDFGSGYPNNRTTEFIRANYERLKPIVRMKWRTIQKIQMSKSK